MEGAITGLGSAGRAPPPSGSGRYLLRRRVDPAVLPGQLVHVEVAAAEVTARAPAGRPALIRATGQASRATSPVIGGSAGRGPLLAREQDANNGQVRRMTIRALHRLTLLATGSSSISADIARRAIGPRQLRSVTEDGACRAGSRAICCARAPRPDAGRRPRRVAQLGQHRYARRGISAAHASTQAMSARAAIGVRP
jgi:hypothetical protein